MTTSTVPTAAAADAAPGCGAGGEEVTVDTAQPLARAQSGGGVLVGYSPAPTSIQDPHPVQEQR